MDYVKSCYYLHPDFGIVRVKVYANARHMRARWSGAELLVTIPANCPVEKYDEFLLKHHDRILAIKPAQKFYIGQVIDAPLVDFTIAVQPAGRGRVSISRCSLTPARGKKINYTILVSEDIAYSCMAEPEVQASIEKMIRRAAHHATESFVVPHADALATKIGRRPLGWEVRDTRHRLGSCSPSGVIMLSSQLAFLPPELVDYVIFHELAHLSEMNHSEAFHRLCNEYCNGREAEFIAAIKTFVWPI